MIDLQTEALYSPLPPSNTLKNKLRRMVVRTLARGLTIYLSSLTATPQRPVKTSRPSRRAVKLFAVKELEDDLQEYRE